MDGFDKGLSPTPPKPPKDGNNQSYQGLVLITQNLEKARTKNFMSPTISAGAKATTPRRKILAERNRSPVSTFSNTHLQKIPNLESKPFSTTPGVDSTDESLSHVTPLSSQRTCVNENEQNGFVDDLSLRPYDPLMNYLSPRPRFLRYKPNRRRPILLQLENEVKEANDGINVDRSASFESREDIDEKSDLVNTSCDFLDVASQEQGDEEIEESDREFEQVEEGSCCLKGVLKFLFLLFAVVLSTAYISPMNSPTPPASQIFEGLADGFHNMQDHMDEIVKSFQNGDQRGGEQTSILEMEEIGPEEMGETVNLSEYEEAFELSEESEVVGVVEDEMKGEAIDLGVEVEPQAEESEAVEIIELAQLESGEMVDVWEHVTMAATQEGFEQQHKMFVTQNLFEKENEVLNGVFEEVFNVEAEAEEMVDGEMGMSNYITRLLKRKSKESLIKDMDTGSFVGVIARGVLTFSAIVGSLVMVLQLKKRRENVRKENAFPMAKPRFDPVIAEKCSSVLPMKEDAHIECTDSFANQKPLINSSKETSSEVHQSRAPSVELLGEFEVGEMSSSIRSYGRKNKMIESEVSSQSVLIEKGIGVKSHSVPVLAKPVFSELSPSSGSFTSEDMVYSEVRKTVVTTPLRRSSRIRIRVVSP